MVVLPLNLVNFAGQYTNGQVILKWQTANEVNVSKFIVQCLINGAYEDVGTVMAKGNASNNYVFNPGAF